MTGIPKNLLDSLHDMVAAVVLRNGGFGKPMQPLDLTPFFTLLVNLNAERQKQLVNFVLNRGVDPYMLKALVDAGLDLETYFRWVDDGLYPLTPMLHFSDTLAKVPPQMLASALPKAVASLEKLIEGKATP